MYPHGTVITPSTFFFTKYENECLSLCSTVVVLYIIHLIRDHYSYVSYFSLSSCLAFKRCKGIVFTEQTINNCKVIVCGDEDTLLTAQYQESVFASK